MFGPAILWNKQKLFLLQRFFDVRFATIESYINQPLDEFPQIGVDLDVTIQQVFIQGFDAIHAIFQDGMWQPVRFIAIKVVDGKGA